MRAVCDATTRKIGERHGRRAIAQFNAYESSRDTADLARLSEMIVVFLSTLDTVPFEPCGWTGDVEDPVAWTCPACLAEHVTPEPDGERDVSPADAAYYADRAADRYEQRLYGGA